MSSCPSVPVAFAAQGPRKQWCQVSKLVRYYRVLLTCAIERWSHNIFCITESILHLVIMASEISSLVIGALFGIAVTASGIASSAVIKSQLQVNNYFLSQVYIVSSACSA